MKVAAVLVTILGVASAFAPQSSGRSSTQLQESLADKVRPSGLLLVEWCGFWAKSALKQRVCVRWKSVWPNLPPPLHG